MIRSFTMLSEEQVKYILGETLFEECLSFFEEMFERVSEYKIILTRRCFSLFKIFAPILRSKNMRNMYGTIISDNAIDFYIDEIREALISPPKPRTASVIILDDIIIYGRTVSSVLNRLLTDGPKHNIQVLCMFHNTNSLLSAEYSELVLSRYGASSLEWKDYSGAFSRLIKSADVANTSYIVSARIQPENFAKHDFVSTIVDHMVYITPKELQELNIESYVVAAELTEEFYESLTRITGFVRVYLYKELESILISPLVILDNLSISDIRLISYRLLDLCGDDTLKRLLLSEDETLYSYKMRLLSLLLSHILLRDFLSKNGFMIDRNDFDYKAIIQYNFSENFLVSFELFDEKISKLKKEYFTYATKDILIDFHELEDYVFRKAMEDNNSATINSTQRQAGFSDFKGEYLFSQKYAGGLMAMIDNGLAALRTFFSDEDHSVVSLIYPGEQAFRIMNDKYLDLLPAMYALENIAHICEKESYELYKKFCYLVYTNELLQDKEYEDFLKYVEILEFNNQQISDVMCIDKSKQNTEVCKSIMQLLNSFKGEVFKS